MSQGRSWVAATATLILAGLPAPRAFAQQMSSFDRDRALQMFDTIAGEVRKHYYDPTFHGTDWDATVLETKQKIKQETSLNMSLAHIAQALLTLNDSHTFFLPPQRPYRHDYGFQTEMIGDKCYVIRVRPGSDAEAKGLKPGNEVLSVDGFQPDRASLWKMNYRYDVLRPEPGLRLVVRDVEGNQGQVDVLAKMRALRTSLATASGARFATRKTRNT
jgi:C-terminal processing protease CtpA/Prc